MLMLYSFSVLCPNFKVGLSDVTSAHTSILENQLVTVKKNRKYEDTTQLMVLQVVNRPMCLQIMR